MSPAPQPHTGPDLFAFITVFGEEGGIQSYLQDLLRAYAQLDRPHPAQVLILRDSQHCPNPWQGDPHFQFHYCKTPSPQLDRLVFLGKFLQTLQRHHPAQIFCGHINLLPLIAPLAQWRKLPYTLLTYGKEVWDPLPPKFQRPLQQTPKIWTISRHSRDQACRSNHLNPDRFQFLPCAVDGQHFTPGPANPQLQEQYGLNGCQVLMTVARLHPGDIYKGVDITIQALPEILKTCPQVKYLVIGRGNDQPRLAQLARDLGVADRVVFAGFVPNEALVDHYRLGDVYVMPSQEGFGIVYMEAMACGVPVISGLGDGSADPLQDGRLGWQVPHRDPQAVAQACLEALAGQDQRCDGVWLREQILATFDRPTLPQTLAQLL